MARRIVSITTLTPTATADTANLADTTYPFILLGGGSSALSRVHEISISGQAPTTSSPTFMLLSRDSTSASGSNTLGTGQTDTALDYGLASVTSSASTGNMNATTKPQRSATAHLLNCSLNAFGGSYFWRANKVDECTTVFGTAAPTGEVSLSAFTGGTPGPIGAHMIYETL